jgi:tRNA_anti-like
MREFRMYTKLTTGFAALASILFLSCSSKTGSGPNFENPFGDTPLVVSAVQLVQDYRTLGDGPGGADKKYKDKVVEVSGVVLSSGNDFGNTVKIELSGGEGVPIGVRCWFEGDAKAPASQVRQGQTVTIQGRCDGRTSSVLLRKCKLK